MENRNWQTDHYVEITVTSNEPTTFQIFIGPERSPFNEPYTLEANSSLQVKIPWELVEAIGSEEIQNKGINLTSEKPVNVYALNWCSNSADVAVIYPTTSLGKEYFAMCYYPDIDLNNPSQGNGRNSEFMVVATENDTQVQITPSRKTDQGRPKDSTFVVHLDRGEIYQVQSENTPDSHLEGEGDLTGSYIAANRPVAFFSGSLSTRIPKGQCCWDHLYEQIPPLPSWGTEYYLAPLRTREQDRYRIMAARNNTIVQISGREPISINQGQFEEIVVFHDDPKRIRANKPVMIAQYSQSRNIDSDFTGGDGDPFMIILNPVSQSKNEITFVAYKSLDLDQDNYTGIKRFFVNVITPTAEAGNIRLNGQPVTEEFTPFPGEDYAFAQIEIDPGTNHIKNLNEEEGFLAYVYGFGGVESYGYGVGFNLNLTLDLGESIEFQKDTMLLCAGSSLTLDAGYYFDTFLWSTGDTTQTLSVSEAGWIDVQTTTIDGCELTDSVYVYVSQPVTSLETAYEEGCYPFELELSAAEGYPKYVWQNNRGDTLSTSHTFVADQSGGYSITVFDEYNCTARSTMQMVVFPAPKTEISGPSLVCGEKKARLSVSIAGTADSIWNFEGSTAWTTSHPSLLVLSDGTPTSVQLEATEWGTYEVYHQLQTIDGCVKNDTFEIRFHPRPEAKFQLENDERCEGYSQKLHFTGSATDSAVFYWDLNGCQFLDTLGTQDYLVSVGAFLEQQPVVSLYIDDNGCMSDTVVKPVGAKPNFTMDASRRRGCDELTVDFTSTMLTEDQVEFKWEFDDGDVADTQNYTKHFSQPGFYDVKITVTNPVTRCVNSYQIDSMIKVFPTPVAAISADPQICHPDSATLIYIHNIDSSLCHWEFEGMHQIGGANDSIRVWLDDPVARVSLTVDEYGCMSDPEEITLKRKPRFDFLAGANEGCQPFETEISVETRDDQLIFEWITDSLPSPDEISGHIFLPEPGSYDVGLMARSEETGCSDTLIKTDWIKVYPKPDADFRTDYQTAFADHARISFFNRSADADLFYWDFGDGAFDTERSPIHHYREPGKYITQLIARSFQDCTDTAQMTITILPSPVHTPNAFRPDSPIEENRTFMPVGPGIDPARFHLSIYNREGQMVFETHSPGQPWDGTISNGKTAPMGNYIWVARFFDIQGIKREQKGQVLLIR